MLSPQTVTPLKISVNSKDRIGVGRNAGLEIFPYTPYLHQRLNLDFPFLDAKQPTEVQELFLKDLRPYQQDDVRLLVNRKSSANFSEPRTGKTPTALRTFKAKGLNKIIIIATAASLYQWKHEFERWYEDIAVVLDPSVSKLKKQEYLKEWGTNIRAIIVSYDSLKIVHRAGNPTGLLSESLKHNDIDGIIVDEAHHIRHRKSLQAKAVFALSWVPNKHIMTGTPAHGRLEDTFSLLHFMYPEIFSSYWRFIDYYFVSEERKNWGTGAEYTEVIGLKNQEELPQFIDRVSVQHKRREVMKWLPDKDYELIQLPLSKQQKAYIKELEQDFETGHLIVENILTQLIRIRQIANSPELVDLAGPSPKLEWLAAYLRDNPEKPTLIFSNFTEFLKHASKKLDLPHMIIGPTPSKQREKVRNDFQSGKINCILINTQAGKEALTLDRAEVAIFLDIYPPYGDVDQAENRFTATRPELKDKPHTIIHVMMEGCYDETLFSLVKERASETAIINSFKHYLERRKSA